MVSYYVTRLSYDSKSYLYDMFLKYFTVKFPFMLLTLFHKLKTAILKSFITCMCMLNFIAALHVKYA